MRVQFYLKQVNVNLAVYYYVVCCVYQGSLEIKSLVTKSFENNVSLTLNPKLNAFVEAAMSFLFASRGFSTLS